MSNDKTYSPGTDLPPDNQSDNSLDELLSTVRDHLGDSSPEDIEIPVLTEVVMAAPANTTPQTDSGSSNTDQSTSPDMDGVIDIEIDEISVGQETTFHPDLTQDQQHSDNVSQRRSGSENRLDNLTHQGNGERWPTDTAATDNNSLTAELTELGDSSDEETFDVTQVASSSETSDDAPPELESTNAHFPADWLERMDQLIDERCHALAAELKMRLRQPMDTTSNAQGSKSAG